MSSFETTKSSDQDSPQLSHLSPEGKARMVNVGNKPPLRRRAVAEGFIEMKAETIQLIRDNGLAKGDVIATANIAGVMGGKECARLIPLCHNIEIEQIVLDFEIQQKGVSVTAESSCTGKTGIEMESLTAVSIALLTLYDMCKAVDKSMVMKDIRLIEKTKFEV